MTRDEYRKEKRIHDSEIWRELQLLADSESKFAHKGYGPFKSPHEGLAIIQEEAAEAKAARRDMAMWLRGMRDEVRGRQEPFVLHDVAWDAYECAIHLAQEAIHTAATLKRFLEAQDSGEGEWAYLGTAEETK